MEDTLKGTRESFALIQPYMGKVRFKEVATNEEAQIVLGFYKNSDLNEPFNVNTLAYAYLGSGTTAFNIVSDVFFNNENFKWALTHDFAKDLYDYIDVCVHEVLHSLGLGHQEIDPTGILYPSYNPNLDIKFTQDTINGLQHIYGNMEGPIDTPEIPTIPETPENTTPRSN